MRVMVNLSGTSGERSREGREDRGTVHPGRLLIFANLDFAGIDDAWLGRRAPPRSSRRT